VADHVTVTNVIQTVVRVYPVADHVTVTM